MPFLFDLLRVLRKRFFSSLDPLKGRTQTILEIGFLKDPKINFVKKKVDSETGRLVLALTLVMSYTICLALVMHPVQRDILHAVFTSSASVAIAIPCYLL